MSRYDLLNEGEEILYAPSDYFEPYPNEKIRMKLHNGEKYEQLKQSIITHGVLQPVIVMPSANRGKFYTIAGWNRVNICHELELEVPYQLKSNLTKEQADLICIDTNLLNRQIEEYKPSELAFILKTKYDIIKNQGKRNDLLDEDETSCTMCIKLTNDYKMSKRNIQYYIRLTYLTNDLLELVDNDTISFRSAVLLSYLKNDEQTQLYEHIQSHNVNISMDIAQNLKKLSQESEDNINIESILSNLSKPKAKLSISKKTIKQVFDYIPEQDREKADEIIIKALKKYYQDN